MERGTVRTAERVDGIVHSGTTEAGRSVGQWVQFLLGR